MKRICSKCNKDLENATVFHIVDDQYICSRCYDFYHRHKYNELDFDNLRKVFRKEQNQKAIKCLKEIFDLYEPYENDEGDVILTHNGVSFIEYIDNKIKELEASSECDF